MCSINSAILIACKINKKKGGICLNLSYLVFFCVKFIIIYTLQIQSEKKCVPETVQDDILLYGQEALANFIYYNTI